MTFDALPRPARAFFWLVLLAGAAALALLVDSARGRLDAVLGLTAPADILTSAGAIALIAIAGLYPISMGNKVRKTVDGVIVLAAILTFHPLRAALVVALGFGLAYAVQAARGRWPAFIVVFNVAQAIVAAAAAGSLYHLGAAEGFHAPEWLPYAGGAAGTYFVVNSSVVATMSGLFQRRNVWQLWRQMYTGPTAVLDLSILMLGAVFAVVFAQTPVAASLVLIPLVLAHRSFKQTLTIRDQTRETLELLADTIDRRDPYTFQHSQRVAEYAREIARRLGLPVEEQDSIALAARVHDVGKLGVPDELLQRPSQLTPYELEQIRTHVVIGARIVSKLPQYQRGRDFILYHHERYDGGGTFKTPGQHIPVGARIIAIADAFDAMTSDRPYRKALDRPTAIAELTRQKGGQFDPVLVEAFLDVLREQERAGHQAETAAPPARPEAALQVQVIRH